MKNLEQLTLNIKLRDQALFSNFYAPRNQEVVAFLQNLVQRQFVYLWGEHGAGKSHLLQACCYHYNHAIYLPLREKDSFSTDILTDLEGLELVCFDDVDCVIGDASWEEALFNVFNRVQQTTASLIFSAATSPLKVKFFLRDLQSRLSSCVIFKINSLTDEEKISALKIRAQKRGLLLENKAAKFLLNHYARDTASLFSFLDRLDNVSLAAKRKLTIPFIKNEINQKH